jgi:predicted phosphate transport protein (TIGR00153 family)
VKADAIIRWFMPKEERFKELFQLDTDNLKKAAQVFTEIAHSQRLEERRVKMTELKAIEHDGDGITRRIFDALNSTFITPLDREDIHWLASDLDEVLDYLESVSQHLVLFELADSPEGLQQFADILVEMVAEIDRISDLLWDLTSEKAIRGSLVRISELENRADQLYNTLIADLFKGRAAGAPADPVTIMKWKEVYDGLENACDQCKDFTHVVSNVVAKNA